MDKHHPIPRTSLQKGHIVACFAPSQHPDPFWLGEIVGFSKNFAKKKDGKMKLIYFTYNCMFFLYYSKIFIATKKTFTKRKNQSTGSVTYEGIITSWKDIKDVLTSANKIKKTALSTIEAYINKQL